MTDYQAATACIESQRPNTFDRTWREATAAANRTFDTGDFERAAELYSGAYHEARLRFAEAWNGVDYLAPHAAPMMVVSARNAARNLLRKGETKAAADQIISAISIFVEAISSRRADPALKAACVQHMPRLISSAVSSGIDTEQERLTIAAERGKVSVLDYLKTRAQ